MHGKGKQRHFQVFSDVQIAGDPEKMLSRPVAAYPDRQSSSDLAVTVLI
jgi:hypothetical protein